MIPAVVMAGGEGTRLRPLTTSLPKPLLPVLNRPMLEGIAIDGDLRIVYSPFDLEAAWQGCEFPQARALTDELVWLITLAPAFLLSLHYGLRGAFAALIVGTVL